MTLRKILLLVVLVAALGTYLVVYELPQADREATKDKLLAVDKEAVTGLTLVYPDREIEVSRSDAGWRLVRPVEAPADEATVKGILATVVDAQVQRTLDEAPQDAAVFGLATPTVTVKLTLKEGTAPTVSVGKNTAIGGKTYVRKGDDPKLYLTASTVSAGLNKQVKDLRDKQILNFQDADVSRVEIARREGETTTVARGDGDTWTVAPGNHPGDATEIRSYLASLRSARATDFPDDAPSDLAPYGLDRPRLAVTVTGKEGSPPQMLLLGDERTQGTSKHVFAKRENVPTIYAIGDWSYRALDKATPQLRDKTVLKLEPTKVGRVELARRDGGTIVLVRSGDAWRIERGAEGKPKEAAITRLLEDAEDLRGADIAAEPPGDLARFGLAAPDVRLVLADTNGKEIGSLLAAKQGGKYYVMRAGSGTVFEVRDYLYARLDKKPEEFVEGTTATTLPPADDASLDGAAGGELEEAPELDGAFDDAPEEAD